MRNSRTTEKQKKAAYEAYLAELKEIAGEADTETVVRAEETADEDEEADVTEGNHIETEVKKVDMNKEAMEIAKEDVKAEQTKEPKDMQIDTTFENPSVEEIQQILSTDLKSVSEKKED